MWDIFLIVRKPEMGNTKPFRLEPGFNYTMPEFVILTIEYTFPWQFHYALENQLP